jgi:hypothetical protein
MVSYLRLLGSKQYSRQAAQELAAVRSRWRTAGTEVHTLVRVQLTVELKLGPHFKVRVRELRMDAEQRVDPHGAQLMLKPGCHVLTTELETQFGSDDNAWRSLTSHWALKVTEGTSIILQAVEHSSADGGGVHSGSLTLRAICNEPDGRRRRCDE